MVGFGWVTALIPWTGLWFSFFPACSSCFFHLNAECIEFIEECNADGWINCLHFCWLWCDCCLVQVLHIQLSCLIKIGEGYEWVLLLLATGILVYQLYIRYGEADEFRWLHWSVECLAGDTLPCCYWLFKSTSVFVNISVSGRPVWHIEQRWGGLLIFLLPGISLVCVCGCCLASREYTVLMLDYFWWVGVFFFFALFTFLHLGLHVWAVLEGIQWIPSCMPLGCFCWYMIFLELCVYFSFLACCFCLVQSLLKNDEIDFSIQPFWFCLLSCWFRPVVLSQALVCFLNLLYHVGL